MVHQFTTRDRFEDLIRLPLKNVIYIFFLFLVLQFSFRETSTCSAFAAALSDAPADSPQVGLVKDYTISPLASLEGRRVVVTAAGFQSGNVVQLWRGGSDCTDPDTAHVLSSRLVGTDETSVSLTICAACSAAGSVSVCLLKEKAETFIGKPVSPTVNASEVLLDYQYELIDTILFFSARHAPTSHELVDASSSFQRTEKTAPKSYFPLNSVFYIGLTEQEDVNKFLPNFCMSKEACDDIKMRREHDYQKEEKMIELDFSHVAAQLRQSYFIIFKEVPEGTRLDSRKLHSRSEAHVCPVSSLVRQFSAIPNEAAMTLLLAKASIATTEIAPGAWEVLANEFTTLTDLGDWEPGSYQTYIVPIPESFQLGLGDEGTNGSASSEEDCPGDPENTYTFSGDTNLVLADSLFKLKTFSAWSRDNAVVLNFTSRVAVSGQIPEQVPKVIGGTADEEEIFYTLFFGPVESCQNAMEEHSALIFIAGKFFREKEGESESEDWVQWMEPFVLSTEQWISQERPSLMSVCIGYAFDSTFTLAGSFEIDALELQTTTLFERTPEAISLAYRFCTDPSLSTVTNPRRAFLSTSASCDRSEGSAYAVNMTDVTDSLSLDPFTAPAGAYTLCFESTANLEENGLLPQEHITGSVTEGGLHVYTPYEVEAPEEVVVTMTLELIVRGGDVVASAERKAFLIPADEPCESVASCAVFPDHHILGWFESTSPSSVRYEENDDTAALFRFQIPASAAHTAVQLCMVSGDETRNVTLAIFEDPLPVPEPPEKNIFPTSMVLNRTSMIQSSRVKEGYVMLSRTENCDDPIDMRATENTEEETDGEFVRVIQNGGSLLILPLCTLELSVYYCESASSDLVAGEIPDWESIEWPAVGEVLHVLSLFSCEREEAINLIPVEATPASPIESFGLTEGFARDPYLSCSSACEGETETVKAVVENGVLPSESSELTYYVCVTSNDGTLNFTTDVPTVSLGHPTLSPRSAAANQTQMSQLTYASSLPEPSTAYWTRQKRCVKDEEDKDVFPAGEIVSKGEGDITMPAIAAQTGIYHLCVSRGSTIDEASATCLAIELREGSEDTMGDQVFNSALPHQDATDLFVPVESMLLIASPDGIWSTPSVVDSVLCVGMEVANGLYSLGNGTDSTDEAFSGYRPYYQTRHRDLFLQFQPSISDIASCKSGPNTSVGDSPSVAAWETDKKGQFVACFNTTGLPVGAGGFSVCAGTPVGVTAVTNAVLPPMERTSYSSTEFVSGAWMEVHFPLFPETTFRLLPLTTVGKAGRGGGVFDHLPIATEEEASPCDEASIPNVGAYPVFTTSASGEGKVLLTMSSAGVDSVLLPEGSYVLCREVVKTEEAGFSVLHPEVEVKLFLPQYFSVYPDSLVWNVTTPVFLLQDLNSSMLMPGLYTSSICDGAPVDESIASWVVPSTDTERAEPLKQIDVVVRKSLEADALYLCAVAEVNQTLLAYPRDEGNVEARGFQFLDAPVRYRSLFTTCHQLNVYLTSDKDDGSEEIAITRGPCCPVAPLGAPNNFTGDLVQLGMHVGLGFRTFWLNESIYDAESEQERSDEFSLCFANPAYRCVSTGALQSTDYSYCDSNPGLINPFETNFSGIFGPRRNSSSVLLSVILISCGFGVLILGSIVFLLLFWWCLERKQRALKNVASKHVAGDSPSSLPPKEEKKLTPTPPPVTPPAQALDPEAWLLSQLRLSTEEVEARLSPEHRFLGDLYGGRVLSEEEVKEKLRAHEAPSNPLSAESSTSLSHSIVSSPSSTADLEVEVCRVPERLRSPELELRDEPDEETVEEQLELPGVVAEWSPREAEEAPRGPSLMKDDEPPPVPPAAMDSIPAAMLATGYEVVEFRNGGPEHLTRTNEIIHVDVAVPPEKSPPNSLDLASSSSMLRGERRETESAEPVETKSEEAEDQEDLPNPVFPRFYASERRARRDLLREEDEVLGALMKAAYAQWQEKMKQEKERLEMALRSCKLMPRGKESLPQEKENDPETAASRVQVLPTESPLVYPPPEPLNNLIPQSRRLIIPLPPPLPPRETSEERHIFITSPASSVPYIDGMHEPNLGDDDGE